MRHVPCVTAVASLLVTSLGARAQTYTWVGGQGSNWFTPQNWSPQMVPPPGAIVVIPIGQPPVDLGNGIEPMITVLTANRTVRVSSNVTVATGSMLDLDFRTTSGALNPFTVTGQLTLLGTGAVWSGGAFAGPGIVINSGTLTTTTGGPKIVDGAAGMRFRNDGSLVLQGGSIEIRSAMLQNMGTIELASFGFIPGIGGAVGTLENAGTITKSAATTASTIGSNFTNSGEVHASVGEVRFTGPVQNYGGGTLRVSDGASITILGAGLNTPAAAGGTLTGDGDIGFGAGPILVAQPLAADLSLGSSRGFFIHTSAGDSTSVTLQSDIVSTGAATFSFGRLDGSGEFTNESTGDLVIGTPGTGGVRIGGMATLHNLGAAEVLGTVFLEESGRIRNGPDATLYVTDGSVSHLQSSIRELVNEGVLRKAASATQGTSIASSLLLLGNSRIEVDALELSLSGASTWSGATTVVLGAPGARLRVSNALVYASGNSAEGQGTLEIVGMNIVAGDFTNRLGPGADAAARLSGELGGAFINLGQLDWVGGSYSGNSDDHSGFRNHGVVSCFGGSISGSIFNASDGRFELVSGALNVPPVSFIGNDGDFVLGGGVLSGDGTFFNSGTLEKTGPSGVTFSPHLLNYAGTVHVHAGTLSISSLADFDGVTSPPGNWFVDEGAILNLPSTIRTLGPQTRCAGSGTSLPWLRDIADFQGQATVAASTSMTGPVQLDHGAAIILLPGVDLTVPTSATNGDDEDVLSEIQEVFVPAFEPPSPPRLLTPLLVNHAVLVPGGHGQPGPFTIVGSLQCTPTSTLDVEIGGTATPEEHDQVLVSDAVSLDGTLRVSFLEPYSPQRGDRFTIVLSSAGVTGSFARIDAPASPGAVWRTRSLGGAVELVLSCPADFDADAQVNSQDFFNFLTAFFSSSAAADLNADSIVNSQDFFDYLAAFFAGC